MKKILIYAALLFLAVVAKGAESTSLERWEAGNKSYIEGNYEKAVEEYRAIYDGGEYSMKLCYNLANAYFKAGEVANAILFYNRALQLAPANEDIRHNLALAEAQTKDRIAVVPEFFLNRWLRTMANSMSCMAWSVLSLAILAVLIAFTLIFLLASAIRVRKAGFYGALVSLLLFVATTSFALAVRSDMLSRENAIVMSSAISVKSSPDNSATDLFVLHEGTKVKVLSKVDNWCEVVIADGKKGWVLNSNIENI